MQLYSAPISLLKSQALKQPGYLALYEETFQLPMSKWDLAKYIPASIRTRVLNADWRLYRGTIQTKDLKTLSSLLPPHGFQKRESFAHQADHDHQLITFPPKGNWLTFIYVDNENRVKLGNAREKSFYAIRLLQINRLTSKFQEEHVAIHPEGKIFYQKSTGVRGLLFNMQRLHPDRMSDSGPSFIIDTNASGKRKKTCMPEAASLIPHFIEATQIPKQQPSKTIFPFFIK